MGQTILGLLVLMAGIGCSLSVADYTPPSLDGSSDTTAASDTSAFDTGAMSDTGGGMLPTCNANQRACGTPPACIDVRSNDNDCGSCGHKCLHGDKCQDFVCQ